MSFLAGKQSVGRRAAQEDSFEIIYKNEQDPGADVLMVLADGMGGHRGGAVASKCVTKAFAMHFVNGATSTQPRARLHESLQAANMALGRQVASAPNLKGMGCTLIGALKMDNRLSWVSVGDSVLYLLRGGQIRRINSDHSLYGELLEMVRDGKLSQQEADKHPRRHALRSAVLGSDISLIDLDTLELEKGDLVVLASDGLQTLSDEEIQTVLLAEKRPDIRGLCSDLLNAVESKGLKSQDNTTVVVYRHTNSGRTTFDGETRWSMTATSFARRNRRRMILAGIAGLTLCSILALLTILAVGTGSRAPEPVAPELLAQPALPLSEPRESKLIGGGPGETVDEASGLPGAPVAPLPSDPTWVQIDAQDSAEPEDPDNAPTQPEMLSPRPTPRPAHKAPTPNADEEEIAPDAERAQEEEQSRNESRPQRPILSAGLMSRERI